MMSAREAEQRGLTCMRGIIIAVAICVVAWLVAIVAVNAVMGL